MGSSIYFLFNHERRERNDNEQNKRITILQECAGRIIRA